AGFNFVPEASQPRIASTRDTNSRGLNGLRIYSLAPDSSPENFANSLETAVTIRTGVAEVSGSCLNISQTTNPSRSGIITSRRIRSGPIEQAFLSASNPLAAVATAKPAFLRLKHSN